ncbi:hypothetical protein CANCADRAFT_110684 [Tortispora caseinolytica NRRL Y-17796]|uniref:Alpha/beta hydrolase fold-3 domain-containing protein n=1 Tax=Tortispora caseinolytica NRRL Y-17796 TaxID=767744 RepID=A0A1E4TG78_9ASCO|nr:hypothetical protein CANCADRAFT_110684 [Tortispora caseinolytica NRRL Y-17796]
MNTPTRLERNSTSHSFMIDQILGRPSEKLKRLQVLLVSISWIAVLMLGPRTPPGAKRLSAILKGLSPWQIYIFSMTSMYIIKNIDRLFGAVPPEPLKNLYTRSFYRAIWISTALDAGFWTAMNIRSTRIRNLASIIFSGYYLIFADQAERTVARYRANINVDMLRVSWSKSQNPYLSAVQWFFSPTLRLYTPLKVKRPSESRYKSSIKGMLYFEGSAEQLRKASKVLLHFPGGGFVTMDPIDHNIYLKYWAKKLRIPIFSINYRKAPEYPYPAGLYDCYESYLAIIQTKGQCIGLSGQRIPEIVLFGDSAGGNFVATTVIKILEEKSKQMLPLPSGIVLAYPCLDLNYTSWLTPEQARYILGSKSESEKEMPKKAAPSTLNLVRSTYSTVSGLAGHPKKLPSFSFDKIEPADVLMDEDLKQQGRISPTTKKPALSNDESSRLQVTSRVAYVCDPIITPEMLRAMAILYLSPKSSPDFENDYLLSPVKAPLEILAQFPRTYIMCGEVDPLVDDSVLFAGRLKEAKLRYPELSPYNEKNSSQASDIDDIVKVMLIRGFSHGFLQLLPFLPEAKIARERCRVWIKALFDFASSYESDDELEASDDDSIDSEEFAQFKEYTMSDMQSETEASAAHLSTAESDRSDEGNDQLEFSSSRSLLSKTNTPERSDSRKAVRIRKNQLKLNRHSTWEKSNMLTEASLLERRLANISQDLGSSEAELNRTDSHD